MGLTERWHTFFDKTTPNMILRLVVMFFGLAMVAASVALTRASGLGTSPISCIPAVLSFTTEWTIGTWTFVINVLFVLIQIVLLRRDFNPIQFLQIAFVFVFSAMIDFFVPICAAIPMPNYGFELFYTIIGVFMTGFGIFLQVKASLITLPGEGIVLAVSKVTKIEFPKCKVAFDSIQGLTGAAISLIAMGGLFGVREGTILSALFVGAVVNACNKLLPNFEKAVPLAGHRTLTAATLEAPAASAKAPVSAPVTEEEPARTEKPLEASAATPYLLERD